VVTEQPGSQLGEGLDHWRAGGGGAGAGAEGDIEVECSEKRREALGFFFPPHVQQCSVGDTVRHGNEINLYLFPVADGVVVFGKREDELKDPPRANHVPVVGHEHYFANVSRGDMDGAREVCVADGVQGDVFFEHALCWNLKEVESGRRVNEKDERKIKER